jgi:hypothetical protein
MNKRLDRNPNRRIRSRIWFGSWLLALGALTPTWVGSQTIPEYLKAVVSRTAPIIIHETSNGFSNVEAKDHILPVDFDGNTIGADNYVNAFDPSRVLNGEPTIYYSVAETGTASDRGYYFIGYYVYHPGDGGGSWTASGVPIVYHGHEHDLEGAYFVVKKTPWSPYGQIEVALTQAHGALIPYKNVSGSYSGNPAGGAYLGFINTWYDQTFSTWRPVVAIRTRTHGTYIAQDCSPSGPHMDLLGPTADQYGMYLPSPAGTYISCIHSGTQNIIYSPVPTNVAPSSGIWPQRLGPSFRNGFAYYRLIELVDSPIWSLRASYGQLLWGASVNVGDGNFFGYSDFKQSGSDHGGGVNPGSTANTPWAWRGGSGETSVTPSGQGAWYSFGSDMTDVTWTPHNWPQSPYGRLLGDPNSEIAMRFPFLPQLAEPTIYNPYRVVPPPPPPSPLSVSLMGPAGVTSGVSSTWQAAASGGSPPYTYQWSGALSGNEEFVSGALYYDDILYLDVWDSLGAHVAVSVAITVVQNCGGMAC